jgi:hypothetical protein
MVDSLHCPPHHIHTLRNRRYCRGNRYIQNPINLTIDDPFGKDPNGKILLHAKIDSKISIWIRSLNNLNLSYGSYSNTLDQVSFLFQLVNGTYLDILLLAFAGLSCCFRICITRSICLTIAVAKSN